MAATEVASRKGERKIIKSKASHFLKKKKAKKKKNAQGLIIDF